MLRKTIGLLTAVGATILVVGIAWASGDDPGVSGSVAANSGVAAEASTPSTDGTLAASINAESSVEADSQAGVTVIDTSSTSTTVGATTSTSVGSTSTSTTVDDRSTLQVTSDPISYDVKGAGTVTIQVVAGGLVLIEASPSAGWSMEIDKADDRDVRIDFESGDSDAHFEAKIRDGELRVRSEIG